MQLSNRRIGVLDSAQTSQSTSARAAPTRSRASGESLTAPG